MKSSLKILRTKCIIMWIDAHLRLRKRNKSSFKTSFKSKCRIRNCQRHSQLKRKIELRKFNKKQRNALPQFNKCLHKLRITKKMQHRKLELWK